MDSVVMLFLLSNAKPKKTKIDRRKLCFINERRLKLRLKTVFIDFSFSRKTAEGFFATLRA
jgi:hypothetical protein